MKKNKHTIKKESKELLSRREALEKAGKYALFTAVGSVLLLTPKRAMAISEPLEPGWGTLNQKPGKPGRKEQQDQQPPACEKDLA